MALPRSTLALTAALALGCADPSPAPSPPSRCAALFGSPNARTGLGPDRCRPVCDCGEAPFVPRAWTADSLAALRSLTDLAPPPALAADPYAQPAPPPPPADAVCAARFESPAGYRMETFATAAAARAARAVVSHGGPCGVCSSLTDLAVYAGTPDLTAPVRACGLLHGDDLAALVTCLAALGFTRPCAQVWAYNTLHTRARCLAVCLPLLAAPYHLADGSLNACLACDEAQSGAVFKAVAGRTRRNSGLANAMCRPCDEVLRLDHAYPGT